MIKDFDRKCLTLTPNPPGTIKAGTRAARSGNGPYSRLIFVGFDPRSNREFLAKVSIS